MRAEKKYSERRLIFVKWTNDDQSLTRKLCWIWVGFLRIRTFGPVSAQRTLDYFGSVWYVDGTWMTRGWYADGMRMRIYGFCVDSMMIC